MPEHNMYNFEYQQNRAAVGKRLAKEAQNDDCCGFLFLGIFKNLLHIFMLIFCFSFAGMIYVVSESNSDDMQLEEN